MSHGQFGWFELICHDPNTVRGFYEQVMGWRFFGDDGGALFAMACVAWAASASIAWLRRRELLSLLPGRIPAEEFSGKP